MTLFMTHACNNEDDEMLLLIFYNDRYEQELMEWEQSVERVVQDCDERVK